jgi:hypothetical protein
MTKAERTELGALVRKRERVLKTAASERAATLVVQFEQQLDTYYSFDQDAIWKAAYEEAEKVVAAASEQIKERNLALGIPTQFAPSLHLSWYGQGQQATKQRRGELRHIAMAQIDELTAKAKTNIERMSLEAQTEIVTNGLESQRRGPS